MDPAAVVALRRAGWAVEQIVTEARIHPGDVARALGARGTAPDSWTMRTLAQAVTWADWRRAGQRVVDVAARAGVSHQRVSVLTLPFGPYPAPTYPVDEWVTARRMGTSMGRISS